MKNGGHPKSRNYPFAAAKSMAEMMEFVRRPGWRQPVLNAAVVKRMNVATNNEAKVVAALRFLGIIDDIGAPTSEFDALKENYKPTLKRLIETHYRELFDILPSEMLTRRKLNNFFRERHQSATNQVPERRSRLFIWFCKEAGIELPILDTDHDVPPVKGKSSRVKMDASNELLAVA